MNTVRLNITIPEDVAKQLDSLVEPKKKSQFITAALRNKIEAIQKEQLEILLEEGYKAARQESLALAKEFEPADLEGWDEYYKRRDSFGCLGYSDRKGDSED